ncbi:MAG: hypothetical protein N5P05_001275 [Chroococcopsis gigantea SAG 12.99]|jgi:hypothetical protein|nr:hypothetical protein [Chlorogloea purpurea SAG 13.99]MDV2999669.1 hypothetical protein [Chroococcopsis gigantea SAG 12.99]
MRLNELPPDDATNRWRYLLDRFVEENQQDLAALAWGLKLEWGDSQDVLGVDIKPTPHFVCCSRSAIETLNRNVGRKVQEILGIIDGYKPEKEVVIIGIGEGQLKLIYFEPDFSPQECFEKINIDLDTLIQKLEEKAHKIFKTSI